MAGMKKFDERQLWIRGNIFKRITMYYVVLLLVNAFLADAGILWADGLYMNVIILMAPIVAGSLEMAVRGALFFEASARQKVLVWLLTAAGAADLIMCAVEFVNGARFVEDGALSGTGAATVMSALILAVPAAFWLKTALSGRKAGE